MGQITSQGNTQTTAEEPSTAPHGLLQTSSSKLKTCKICFEERQKGIVCKQSHESLDHFICSECFSPFVQSVLDNPGKLCDDAFVMKCPVPGCCSPAWTSRDVRLALDGEVLDAYVDSLVRALSTSGSAGAAAKSSAAELLKHERSIENALNLSCPKCCIALDPTPDGCAAMRCAACGTHFCWLCLSVCESSKTCHSHIVTCASNPSHLVFPPRQVVDNAHRHLRVKAIQRQLEVAFGVNWRSDELARRAVTAVAPVLKQALLSAHDIFTKEDTVLPIQAKVVKKKDMDLTSFISGGLATPFVLYAISTVMSAAYSTGLVPRLFTETDLFTAIGDSLRPWLSLSTSTPYSVMIHLLKSAVVGAGFQVLTKSSKFAVAMSMMWHVCLLLLRIAAYMAYYLLNQLCSYFLATFLPLLTIYLIFRFGRAIYDRLSA